MAGLENRDFSAPDETRTPDKTTVDLVNLAGGQIGRYTFQPGWRWSECIKPVAGTDSCQVEHIGYAVSGTLHVKHDDGTDGDVVAGQVYRIAPGHDAWNAGSEAAVFVEFQGAANYAKG
jgi:hypothetical protein